MRRWPVPMFSAVMVAAGIDAPEASNTSPVIRPAVCAGIGREKLKNNSATNSA